MKENKFDYIYQNAKAIFTEIVELRRYFHQHPELSHKEFETTNYICDYLNNLSSDLQGES